MATMPIASPAPRVEEIQADFGYPQREAAFFYGLFLRGHPVEQLRRDIQVPPEVLAKWQREAERSPLQREFFERVVDYRRHVLAIFEFLIGSISEGQLIQ